MVEINGIISKYEINVSKLLNSSKEYGETTSIGNKWKKLNS